MELELELARESAARFRDLVENAPCCIHELDQEGRFLWMNPAGLRMANEPDEARIIGARCLDYVVEEDRPRVAAALHAAQNGQKSGCEFTCKNRRIIRVSYVPISDGKVMGIALDITEQVQTESALISSEARYRRAERGANDGLWEWNLVTGQTVYSPRFATMLGYAEGELPTDLESLQAALHPDERDAVLESVQRHLESGRRIDMELRLRCKSGEYLWVHTRGVVDYDEHGRPVLVTGTIRDISERKHAATALQQERDRLRQILDAQFGFVCVLTLDGVVVEVNQTPLTLMRRSRDEVVGRRFDEAGWLEADDGQSIESVISTVANGATVREVFTANFPALGRRDVDSIFAPLRDSSGQVTNIISFGVDISDRNRAVQALRSSEARLKEAQRIAGIGSWELNYATSELEWSAEIFRIFEIDPAGFDSSYEAFLSAIHPEDRAMVNAAYADSVENREPYDIVHRLLMRDGRVKYVRERCETEYDPAGIPIRSVGTIQDITERVHVEFALRTSEARLRDAHSIARLGAWELDVATQMCWWSDEQYALFGVQPSTPISQSFFLSMVHPEDRASIDEAFRRLVSEGRIEMSYRIIRPDGQVRYMLGYASMTRNATGGLIRVHGTNQDVTERRQAAYETQHLRDTLAHANRLETLNELASGLAHELNQPLGIISIDASTAQFLSRDLDCPGLHPCLQRICDQAFRAGEIVRRIRSFIRRDASARVRADLNLLVSEVLKMLGDHLRHSSVTIELDLAKDLPLVMVDSIQIQQVLVNLVRNAVDAMSQTEQTRRVLSIATELKPGEVQVTVQDTGCGLEPAIAAKLFFPFQTTKTSGLGLGLVTCRSIIDAHCGRIEARSNPDRGTSFLFTVPVF
ncbi:MAG: PAS domain-containing sensor histidine kinase [Aureliella sp.]